MNRKDAKIIAEKITNEELKSMFDTAKVSIQDWTKASIVNKGLSKGIAWNILAKDFDVNQNHHMMSNINMVREFGEFLPVEIKPEKKTKRNIIPSHQDPIF